MGDYDAIVIGAGCGGVTAGVPLAKQGRSVLMLEQGGLVGGCCSTHPGGGVPTTVASGMIAADLIAHDLG